MAITNAGRETLLHGDGLRNEVTQLVLIDASDDLVGDTVSLNSDDWVWVNNQLRLDTSFQVEFNEAVEIKGAYLRRGTTTLWELFLDTNISIPSEGGFITFAPEQQTIFLEIE